MVDKQFDLKKYFARNRRNLLILFGILCLSLGLRLYNLTELPIFGDEAIYIRWSQIMRADATLRFVPLSDGKQPLFMWVAIPFLKLIANPLIAGRVVSVLSGVGATLGVYVLTYVLFEKHKAARLAAFLYAVSPYSLFFDRMALVDALLTFFGVWTLTFAVITAKKLRLDTAMLTGFFLGGALLTKSPAIFFALLIPVTLLVHNWPKGLKAKFYRLCVFVFLFTFTYAIGFGMQNILRLGPNYHMLGARNLDYVYPYSHIFTNPLDPFTNNLGQIVDYYLILGTGILFILIALGLWFNYKKVKKEMLILAFWWLVPTLASAEYAKVITARYVLFALPYAAVLAGLCVGNIKKGFGLITYFGLAVFVLLALRNDVYQLTDIEAAPLPTQERSGYLEEWTAGGGIAEVAEVIRELYQEDPGTPIVVGTEGYFGTLPDGLQIYLNDLPEIKVIGVGIDLGSVPQSLIDSQKAGNKTYLVVNASRLLFDTEDSNLVLIAAYPKAFRNESTKQFNIHGPQDTLYLFELTDEKASE